MIQFGSGHLLSPNLMPDPSQNLALVAPETREAHGGAEFPGFGLLLARDSECPLEILLRFRRIPLGRLNRDFTCDTIDLGLAPTFLGRVHHRHRIIFDVPSLIKLVEPFMGRLAKSEQSVKQGIVCFSTMLAMITTSKETPRTRRSPAAHGPHASGYLLRYGPSRQGRDFEKP